MIRVPVVQPLDIVDARRKARALAVELGFDPGDQALIATAITELSRNILQYANGGEVSIAIADDGSRKGIELIATDAGPGIADPDRAMRDGYSTGAGLGLGLPGTRRIMDEFELETGGDRGTRIAVKKWTR